MEEPLTAMMTPWSDLILGRVAVLGSLRPLTQALTPTASKGIKGTSVS
jgi:hypothetical protein